MAAVAATPEASSGNVDGVHLSVRVENISEQKFHGISAQESAG